MICGFGRSLPLRVRWGGWFFYDYRQLRLGKSWVFPDGSSIRLYGGQLVLEGLKVLGVGVITPMTIVIKVLLGIVDSVGMMIMSIKLVGQKFYVSHEE